MKNAFQGFPGFLFGTLAALVSIFIVLGSFALAIAEGNLRQVLVAALSPSNTPTLLPTSLPSPATPIPGQPTYTSTTPPTSTATATQVTPTETPMCPPPVGWVRITLTSRETLANLAGEYGIGVDEMANKNCTTAIDTLLPAGTDVNVPLPTPTPTHLPTSTPTKTLIPPPVPAPTRCVPPMGWTPYIVKHGDTLYHIASLYGLNYRYLQQVNCLSDPNRLAVGQTIFVPNTPTITPTSSETPLPTHTPPPPPSSTPSPLPSNTPPPPTPQPQPTETPTLEPTHTPEPTSQLTPTMPATGTPTETPTPTEFSIPPTITPTETPTPTLTTPAAPADDSFIMLDSNLLSQWLGTNKPILPSKNRSTWHP
jgi:LysM repeat protein